MGDDLLSPCWYPILIGSTPIYFFCQSVVGGGAWRISGLSLGGRPHPPLPSRLSIYHKNFFFKGVAKQLARSAPYARQRTYRYVRDKWNPLEKTSVCTQGVGIRREYIDREPCGCNSKQMAEKDVRKIRNDSS